MFRHPNGVIVLEMDVVLDHLSKVGGLVNVWADLPGCHQHQTAWFFPKTLFWGYIIFPAAGISWWAKSCVCLNAQRPGLSDPQPASRTYALQCYTSSWSWFSAFFSFRDALFRLRLHDLRVLEKAVWSAEPDKIELCHVKGQSEDDCRNYVNVLLRQGKRLLTCGTYAFSPVCTWREVCINQFCL